MTITIKVQGQQDVQRVLERLREAIRPEDILDEAGALLLNRIRTRFLSKISPDLVPWDVSKAALLRAKRGLGGGTLYDTGRLFHSIQLAGSGASERALFTDVPYAGYHNFGTATLPKREFMGFGDADTTIVSQMIIKRIREAMA